MFGKDLLKTIVIFVLTIGVTVGAAIALNTVTGPKIAADKAYREELAAQQAAGELKEVLPEAAGFEDITAELTLDAKGLVVSMHKATNGVGYAYVAEDKFGDMVNNVKVTVGVGSDGIIKGVIVSLTAPDYGAVDGKVNSTLNSIVGQDSALGGYVISAGATHSSTAIKNAISAGFEVLTINDLMKAAEKSVEQVFSELLPEKVHGFIKGDNVAELPEGISEAYVLKNKSTLVAYAEVEGVKLATLSNVSGNVVVYKTNLLDEKTQAYELVDVTLQYETLVAQVATLAQSNLKTNVSTTANKVKSLFGLEEKPELTEISINNLGVVTTAATVEIEGETYYVYQTKPINDFANDVMTIYVILDSEGNIYKVSGGTYFFGNTEHFPPANNFDKNAYESGLEGLTPDNFDNSDVLITGATKTTNAVKLAVKAAFAEFAALGGSN